MTRTEQQRIALALLKARPEVFPGTRVVCNDNARKAWYDCVSAIAEVCAFPDTKAGNKAASCFFDAAGVPE